MIQRKPLKATKLSLFPRISSEITANQTKCCYETASSQLMKYLRIYSVIRVIKYKYMKYINIRVYNLIRTKYAFGNAVFLFYRTPIEVDVGMDNCWNLSPSIFNNVQHFYLFFLFPLFCFAWNLRIIFARYRFSLQTDAAHINLSFFYFSFCLLSAVPVPSPKFDKYLSFTFVFLFSFSNSLALWLSLHFVFLLPQKLLTLRRFDKQFLMRLHSKELWRNASLFASPKVREVLRCSALETRVARELSPRLSLRRNGARWWEGEG